jgi:hypothetical protein
MTDDQGDLDRLKRLLADCKLDAAAQAWRVAGVSVTIEDVQDHTTVIERARTARAGWLTVTDRVLICDGGAWISATERADDVPQPGGDRALAADLALGDGDGLAIQHVDEEWWRLVRVIEDNREGWPCLARDHVFETVMPDRPQYRVRSYWFPDSAGSGYAAQHTRFLSFVRQEVTADGS